MNIVGLDIGGTKCTVIIGRTEDGGRPTVLGREVVQTRDHPDPYEMIGRMQAGMDNLLAAHHIEIASVGAIGISCGGPLDSVKGVVLSPPNLPGWDEVPIVDLFTKKYGVPAFLQNDANACALAEWLMGAGRGTSNMVFLTFGTGMGAGLIMDGKLYSGTNDLGGEVGHMRLAETGPVGYGKAGSFEGFCSGGGIAQLARSVVSERLKSGRPVGFCPTPAGLEAVDTKAVSLAARAGDPTALEVIGIAAEYLGRGLAVIIDILNPECIVIGSVFARNEELFRPRMEEVLRREALPPALKVCRIKPAELGDAVGDYAALGVAVYGRKA